MRWFHIGVDVTETRLPGVGRRYDLRTSTGAALGIVTHRSGEVEVVSYPFDDPDACTLLVRLTAREAETVAEILGAPRITDRAMDLTREIPGLQTGQVPVPAGSAFAGRPLGTTRARTRTGASVVAIVRPEGVLVSPSPEEQLRAGDVLVVIGAAEAIDAVRAIVSG